MNCTYHSLNPVLLICIASHKCELQRKLCIECQQEHGVEVKETLPLRKFEEMVKNKLKEFQLDDTSELTKERMKCKSLLSQTQSLMRNILDEISELFRQIFDRIEQESKSFTNLINDNPDLAQISNSELEKLVQILEGKILNDFIIQKNSFLVRLEKSKYWFEKEIKSFGEKLKAEINELVSFFSIKPVAIDLKKDSIPTNLKNELEINNQKIQELTQIDRNELKKVRNELIELQVEIDVLRWSSRLIMLNVKSFSTKLSQIFKMQLKDSISDLYIMAVQKGIYKGSPQDCCLFVPSKNIRYAATEWNKRFQDIFFPPDYNNKTITLEFCRPK